MSLISVLSLFFTAAIRHAVHGSHFIGFAIIFSMLQGGKVVLSRAVDWDSEDLSSLSGSDTYFLYEFGQVT